MLDTNPPDDDHPLYRMAEEIRPSTWGIYKQPGALIEMDGRFVPNPAAENIENLRGGINYYLDRVPGRSLDHIRVYYCGQYGFVIDGKPVHPDYVDATHCSDEILKPVPGLTIFVGLDFGLCPAATFGQRLPNGRWIVFDEIVSERMGTDAMAELLNHKLKGEYAGFGWTIYGDPAGSQEAQTDRRTPFQILEAAGLPAEPAHENNDPELRREALRQPLRRMIDGKPGFIISPKAKMLRKALKGGFCFRRMQVAGDERYTDKPDKNRYSHIAEACEYMCLGAGEGKALISPQTNIDLNLSPPAIEIERAGGSWMAM